MSELERRIQNVQKHALRAFYYYSIGELDITINYVRKAAEAVCRTILLSYFGEADGMEIITGRKDRQGNPIHACYSPPTLGGLIYLIDGLPPVNKMLLIRMFQIKEITNTRSHDPLRDNDACEKYDALSCIGELKKILGWLFETFLQWPLPTELSFVTTKKNISGIKPDLEINGWNRLAVVTEYFNNSYDYILISPPWWRNVDPKQLAGLFKIPWSLVLDFDTFSMDGGSYAIAKKYRKDVKWNPITIRDYDDSFSNRETVNWVFANGRSDIPSTTSKDFLDWISNMEYGFFLDKVIEDAVRNQTKDYILLCFWNNILYTREIIRKFLEYGGTGHIKFIFIAHDPASMIEMYDEFKWVNPVFIQLSLHEIFTGINNITGTERVPNRPAQETYMQSPDDKGITEGELPEPEGKERLSEQEDHEPKLIPCRTQGGDSKYVDISTIYPAMLKADIEVVYKGIEINPRRSYEQNSFLKGNVIGWDELAEGIDIPRSQTPDMISDIKRYSRSEKGIHILDMHHQVGAGGTTIARRIAYEMHTIIPTIIINKFTELKTSAYISHIRTLTGLPVFVIFETDPAHQKEIDQIISGMQKSKRHIIVLIVNRGGSGKKFISDRHYLIPDHVETIEEKNNFINLYALAASRENLKKVIDLNDKDLRFCEVIDFPLNAFNNQHSQGMLMGYISNYLKVLTKREYNFVRFTSLIYYFTGQSNISARFYKLSEQKLHALAGSPGEQIIKKLLDQEVNPGTKKYMDLWKPRFDFFTPVLLKCFFGMVKGWRRKIPETASELIRSISKNSKSSDKDVVELFKILFLPPDEESGNSSSHPKLMDYIPGWREQKKLFFELSIACPHESCFHDHFFGLILQQAKNANDLDLAMEEISVAASTNEPDYRVSWLRGILWHKRICLQIENRGLMPLKEVEEIIKSLMANGIKDFGKSRAMNPLNIQTYISESQMLIDILRFGGKKSGNNARLFIFATKNQWYEKLISIIFKLIDEAKFIIGQTGNGISEEPPPQFADLKDALFRVSKDFNGLLEKFTLIGSGSEKASEPLYRKMNVYLFLNSRSEFWSAGVESAWGQLPDDEFDDAVKMLEQNLMNWPGDHYILNLWIKADRVSGRNLKIPDYLKIIRKCYNNENARGDDHREFTFYLYVIYAVSALTSRTKAGAPYIQLVKDLIEECRGLIDNDNLYTLWYSNQPGINSVMYHSPLGKHRPEADFFPDQSIAIPAAVQGVIESITDDQHGMIKLSCGIEAEFCPSSGKFSKDHEAKEVLFHLSFGYSGLFAWDVQLVNSEADTTETLLSSGKGNIQEEAGVTVRENSVSVSVDEADSISGIPAEAESPDAVKNDVANKETRKHISLWGRIENIEGKEIYRVHPVPAGGLTILGKVDLGKKS